MAAAGRSGAYRLSSQLGRHAFEDACYRTFGPVRSGTPVPALAEVHAAGKPSEPLEPAGLGPFPRHSMFWAKGGMLTCRPVR